MSYADISTALIKCLVKTNEKSLAQIELENILNRDIHDKSLGCKIPNTHIRIGKVHLNTFYEAQLLFGNAYWTDIFSHYCYNHIVSIIKANKYRKKRPIILYGYETYSTLTLNKTLSLLESNGYNAHLRIFEIKDERVRYCEENNYDSYLDQELINNNPIIFYFVGISSTLSTFEHMNKALRSVNCNYDNLDKHCVSIIQVVGQTMTGSNDASQKFLGVDKNELGTFVTSKYDNNYLQFIINENHRKVYYYVSVKSIWYTPEECELCMPKENYILEQPLIEVNESSVVPTQMIRLNEYSSKEYINDPIAIFSNDNTTQFLNDIKNSKFLHYDHIERNNNHFQYYFRLSRLYHEKKAEIEKWLNKIKQNYNFLAGKNLNIIVAPQHYSNAGFINSVNNIIFEGTAHIIEFDIHKEYRSNFKAKYNNYSELEKIISDLTGYNVNFYYVNDQIISGTTFYRTKSLINSLFTLNNNNSFNIFRGIFVLLNRNSYDTRKNYICLHSFEKSGVEYSYLPYFSYLNLDIPSLRSYDDSCPLCFERNKSLEIIDECALDSSVLYWQEKILFHRKKSISDARKLKPSEEICEKHFRKLQCENDLWISIKKSYKQISNEINTIANRHESEFKRDVVINNFFECIKKRIDNVADEKEKIEYLISYIKTMSRALLYYQEDVKRASFYILLKIFSYFESSVKNDNDSLSIVFPENFPIGDNYIYLDLNQEELSTLRYDLYRITIARLCATGSCVLLDKDRLINCRRIGNYMQDFSDGSEECFDVFLLNSVKKLLCYDKGNSKAILLNKILWDYTTNSLFAEDDFYIKLFLENIRNPIYSKDSQTAEKITNIQNLDITKKYSSLSQILKEECLKNKNTFLQIQFFTQINKPNSSVSTINITEGEIQPPLDTADFTFNKEQGIYYIRIGNNFETLKSLDISKQYEFEKILEKELKIIKNANIIIGVRTDDIEHISIIMKYRKEIIEIVQSDFNNDAIPQLIVTRGEAKMLSEIKTVTHNNKPLQEFENIFKKIRSGSGSYDLQRSILSLYMDTVISIAHREKLRFEYNFSNPADEGSMFNISYYLVEKRLEYAEELISNQYPHLCLDIGTLENGSFVSYEKEKQDKIRKSFETDYMIIRFRNSAEICEPYMIIKTFLDNAYKHCDNPTVSLRLIENTNGSFDLYVENTIPRRIASPSDKGITLTSLKYIFNEVEPQEERLFVVEPKQQENIFRIIFKGFVLKII